MQEQYFLLYYSVPGPDAMVDGENLGDLGVPVPMPSTKEIMASSEADARASFSEAKRFLVRELGRRRTLVGEPALLIQSLEYGVEAEEERGGRHFIPIPAESDHDALKIFQSSAARLLQSSKITPRSPARLVKKEQRTIILT